MRMSLGAIYRHTQIGWLMLAVLGAVGITGGIQALREGPADAWWGVAIVAVSLALVPTLTVIGDDDGLDVRFGLGLIHRRFRWSDIRTSAPVRNSWLTGWGIRWIGGGWMFNVSGFHAVELQLENGRIFRIGTDDPGGLHVYIQEQLDRVRRGKATVSASGTHLP